jgi:HAD superfamily hydrolase (TIGR01450 family)
MRTPEKTYGGYIFDLDGTVYLGDELLPGARETVAQLKRRASVLYLTNKPLESPADYAAKLTRLGIETRPEEVVSSTDALLLYLGDHAPDARLAVIGEPPLVGLLESAGHEVTGDARRVEVVVVSFDRTFDYRKLKLAFDAVRLGARVVATNPDAYCPSPDGGLPDCAAMLAAVEACTGARAEAVVGKPSMHMAEAALKRLGLAAGETLLVGDRIETDMKMAKEAGMKGALVLTGATSIEEVEHAAEKPDYVVRDLSELLPVRSRA